MLAAHFIRSLYVAAVCCMLGCNPRSRTAAEQPKQTKAATAVTDRTAAKTRAWDLGIGTVELPSYLSDHTWYEYLKPGHALSSISISFAKMPPNLLSGWVQNQRARLQSTQLAEVGEVEKFSNPHFAIEGFWSHEKGATEPTDTTYLLVLASREDLLMFWVQTPATSASAVHDFAARIVPDGGRVPPPLDEWVWRRAFDVRVRIPRGASEPKQFRFEGERVTVLVTPGGPGQPVSLMPSDVGAKLTTPLEHVTKSIRELPVRILTSSGFDVDGEPMTLTAASVQGAHLALLLQGQAFGESTKCLSSAWNDIATNATLPEK